MIFKKKMYIALVDGKIWINRNTPTFCNVLSIHSLIEMCNKASIKTECNGTYGSWFLTTELTFEQQYDSDKHEILCMQTGNPCGYPCFGDCDKVGILVNK